MSDTDEFPAVKPPTPPAELWGLWDGRDWVVAIDDFPGAAKDAALVFFSREDAAIAAEAELEQWDVHSIPYRLIPPTPNPGDATP